ncbi:NAD(P)-binding protein [Xylaria sp. CBS 124048]|nr:NAD(P)-binding protein [Xylaria sp. CBS 124048]
MLTLAGKHCVITGGSRGIGLGIAKLFAAEGATCTLVGRHRDSLVNAVSSLESLQSQPNRPPHRYEIFTTVASADDWQVLMDRFKTEKIDVLVNAAGITLNSLLYNAKLEDIEQVLDTNLKGTILGCRAVIPKMMRQKEGCIINVSSILATHGGRGASVYAATKAGIIGLTRSLAWEVGRFNIRANLIQPGYIQTDMTAAMDSKIDAKALIPMGRLGLVEDVAEAAAFLAKNSYAHNCVLNIDGGLSAT